MSKLKTAGYATIVITAVAWGATYFLAGPSAFPMLLLAIAGAVAASFFALDWAEEYTS